MYLFAGFDAVIASEILEHVNDVDGFVGSCVRMVRPGAPIFFTTINKTIASRLLAVWLAEVYLHHVFFSFLKLTSDHRA